MFAKVKPFLITAVVALVAVYVYRTFIQPRVSVLPAI